MFSFRKGLDVITLFHSPSVPASKKVLDLLKRASTIAAEHSTSDSLAQTDPVHLQQSTLKTEFELNVVEEPPTHDQLRSILDYVGASRAGEVIEGATSDKDALAKWKRDQNSFKRPITVDWNNGKAVAGSNDSEIIKMLQELPK